MKRLFGILVALLCVTACMLATPMEANAATEGYYTYSISSGKATITDVDTSISGDITIPSTLGGYPVTIIGYSAFKDCTGLTGVTIPDSVTSISTYAFSRCSSLTNIIIPDSVTTIGGFAFSSCTELTCIRIPDSVTTIGSDAFSECSGLTDVYITDLTAWCMLSMASNKSNPMYYAKNFYLKNELITDLVIPDSATSISSYVFCNFDSVTSVTIPNTVTNIGSAAFSGCSNLAQITIPDSVTNIGSAAFSGCSSLEQITIPFVGRSIKTDSDTNQYPFGYIFGTTSYSGSMAVTQYYYGSSTSSVTNSTYYIPSSLKSVTVTGGNILYGAFRSCTGLTNVTIPDSVTHIGDRAFYNCVGLNEFILPSRVIGIGERAFYKCSGLTNIIIPEHTNNIGNYAFSNCTGFKEITIPDSVTSIGNSAFSGCSALEKMTIPFVGDSRKTSVDTSQYPFGYIFGTSSYTGGTAITQSYYGNSTSSTTSSTYYIPSNLKDVTVLGGDIVYGAFYNCRNLTNITIGNNVSNIGGYAFYNCSGLDSISIPPSVTNIGSSAFSGCSGLTGVCISDLAAWCLISFENTLSNPLTYAKNLYLDGTLLTDLVIPNGVISINSNTFNSCTSLTSISISDSVSSIGTNAFSNCTNVTDIAIPGSVSSIGSSAFSGCTALTSITIPGSVAYIPQYMFSGCTALTDVTISNSVVGIADYAFHNCIGLISIAVPESVTSIGDHAFYGCTNLSKIWIDPANPNYSSDARGSLYSKDKTVLIQIPKGTIGSYEIADSVTKIGMYAFYECIGITELSVPDSVLEIGYSAFYNCRKLTAVHIDDLNAWCSVDFSYKREWDEGLWVDSYANPLRYAGNLYINGEKLTNLVLAESPNAFTFDGCDLDSVTFTDQVGLNTGVFRNCMMKSLYIPGGPLYLEPYALNGCRNIQGVFYLPSSVTSVGDWNFWGPSIEIMYLESLTKPSRCDDQDYGNNSAFKNVIYGCKLVQIDGNDYIIKDGEAWFIRCASNSAGVVEILSSVNYDGVNYNVTKIGDFAFYMCAQVTSIIIPPTVKFIGKSPFTGCDNLKKVEISDLQSWCDVVFNYSTSNPLYRGCGLYLNGALVTDAIIPDGTEKIRKYTFYDYTDLISVQLPESLTTIEDEAFLGCTKLSKVTIPNSVTNIGYFAFYSCSNLCNVTYCGSDDQWNNIAIGSGNTELENVERSYHDYQNNLCTVCGNRNSYLCQWNITLQNDFAVNFFLNVKNEDVAMTCVRVTIGEIVNSYAISDLPETENGYQLTVRVAAPQMNDEITIEIMVEGEVLETKTYSVRQYCDTILADESFSQYHAIVKEMLNYGAMAQVYFDYDTDNLANDGITGADNEDVPETTDELSISDSVEALNFYGASLVHRDRIAIRYYFTGDITGCTFTANGKTYKPVAKDGMYYVEIADILPQDLDQQIILTVTDSQGKNLSVAYSPMNYIVRMNQKGSVALQNLMKALYNYHLAAKNI